MKYLVGFAVVVLSVSPAFGAKPTGTPSPAASGTTDDPDNPGYLVHWSTLTPPPSGYVPCKVPDFCPHTNTARGDAPVRVYGEPRNIVGHPCTLWDARDVQEMQAKLKADPKVRASFENLKKRWTFALPSPPAFPRPPA